MNQVSSNDLLSPPRVSLQMLASLPTDESDNGDEDEEYTVNVTSASTVGMISDDEEYRTILNEFEEISKRVFESSITDDDYLFSSDYETDCGNCTTEDGNRADGEQCSDSTGTICALDWYEEDDLTLEIEENSLTAWEYLHDLESPVVSRPQKLVRFQSYSEDADDEEEQFGDNFYTD